MKFKFNIKQKLQLFIIISTVVVFTAALGYISLNSRNRDIQDSKEIIYLEAEKTANLLQDRINTDINVARNIRNSFLSWHKYPRDIRDSIYLDIQKDILIANPDYISIATSWEYYHVDTAWHQPYGRVLWGWYRENGDIKELKVERHLDGDDVNSMYYELKTGKFELFNDPEPYSYTGRPEDEVLSTNVSVPILTDNEFIGLVGIDIDLSRFQNIILEISPFESSYAFVLSRNMLFVAHPNAGNLGLSLYNRAPEMYEIQNIEERITNGEAFSANIYDHFTGAESYVSFYPISIDGIDVYWTVGISVPVSVITRSANNDLAVSMIIGIIGILLIVFITWYISKKITFPIKNITSILEGLSKGKVEKSMHFKFETGDEFQKMGNALNTSIEGLAEKSEFSSKIGQGDLETELNLLSDEDILGKSLLNMRDNLLKAKEEESVRKIEDEKRSWATEGYAKFGEILRIDNDNIESLSLKVIQNLVNYVGANQGGIFILNDNDPANKYLEMTACYAYDRQKFIEKKVEIGEGLIGTCFREAKTIYMTDIPDSYGKIGSGLGFERPKALLIVPLILNEEVYGIIELASFKKFEKHQIEFIEKNGESIASTISNIKINIRTNELLEKSQRQAEEMKSQEEEMRQNMEELSATQEEMARKTSETEGIINALNASSYTLEYDLEGYVTNISDSYCNFLGIPRSEAVGKHHAYKIDFTDEQKKEYKRFWDDLKNGSIKKQQTKVVINDNTFHLMETYAPIFDTNGNVTKIFKIANDVTASKEAHEVFSEQNVKLEGEIKELKNELVRLKKENEKLVNDIKKKNK